MILTVKDFKKEKVLVEGTALKGTVTSEAEQIEFQIFFKGGDRFLQFKYTATDYNKNVKHYNYQVRFTDYPSNLGKGEILYFVCPVCYRPCRTIFMVNGCTFFKCRKCYSTLPYPTQSSSRMYRSNSQFFNVQRKLEQLYKMRETGTYKGKQTRRSGRIEALESKLEFYDHQRIMPTSMPLKLRRIIYKS